MAVEHVTGKYNMGGADAGGGVRGELPGTSGGGLVDVSAAAPDHSAVASPELQRAVQVGLGKWRCNGAADSACSRRRAFGGQQQMHALKSVFKFRLHFLCAMQDFFENRGAAAAAVERERADAAGPQQPAAREDTGQGEAGD